MKPKLKPLGSKRWKLKCDVLLSNIAFKFNLRRYTAGVAAKAAGSWRGDAKDPEFKLTMIERIYEYAAGGVSKRWAAAAAEAAAAAAAVGEAAGAAAEAAGRRPPSFAAPSSSATSPSRTPHAPRTWQGGCSEQTLDRR